MRKRDWVWPFLGISVLAASIAVGCGGGTTVSGPTEQPGPVAAATPTPVATPQPVAPVATVPSKDEAHFGPNASYSVRNTGDITRHYTAYITSFDNQSLPIGNQQADIRAGDNFDGSFGRGCVQLDLTNGQPGDAPFAFAYYDQNGAKVGSINADIRAACNPKPVPPRTPDPIDVCPNLEGNQSTVPDGYHKDERGQCVHDPVNCVSHLADKVYGTATACLQNHYTQPWTRAVVVDTPAAYGGAACLTPTSGTDTFDCQSICYYNVPNIQGVEGVDEWCKVNNGGNPQLNQCQSQPDPTHTYHHVVEPVTASDGHDACLAQPGFISWQDTNNLCGLTYPGVKNDKFNLNGGQSDPLCLKKN